MFKHEGHISEVVERIVPDSISVGLSIRIIKNIVPMYILYNGDKN